MSGSPSNVRLDPLIVKVTMVSVLCSDYPKPQP